VLRKLGFFFLSTENQQKKCREVDSLNEEEEEERAADHSLELDLSV